MCDNSILARSLHFTLCHESNEVQLKKVNYFVMFVCFFYEPPVIIIFSGQQLIVYICIYIYIYPQYSYGDITTTVTLCASSFQRPNETSVRLYVTATDYNVEKDKLSLIKLQQTLPTHFSFEAFITACAGRPARISTWTIQANHKRGDCCQFHINDQQKEVCVKSELKTMTEKSRLLHTCRWAWRHSQKTLF